MVNCGQAHMPWVISKIDEAIYRVNPARVAASYEAITDLNKVLGSEHGGIIVGFAHVQPDDLSSFKSCGQQNSCRSINL